MQAFHLIMNLKNSWSGQKPATDRYLRVGTRSIADQKALLRPHLLFPGRVVATFCGYDQAAQDGRRGAAVRSSNSSRDVPGLRSRSTPQWLPRRWRTAPCQTGGCNKSGRGTYIRRRSNVLFGFSSQPPQSRSNLVCVRQRPGSSPAINTDALCISTSFRRFSRTRKVGRTVRNDGTTNNQSRVRFRCAILCHCSIYPWLRTV
jgi:hypothetical protein